MDGQPWMVKHGYCTEKWNIQHISIDLDCHHLVILYTTYHTQTMYHTPGSPPLISPLSFLTHPFQVLTALPAANKAVEKLRDRVPSSVWMVALPQLISRVCHPHAEVAALTRSIIAAAAQAHPQQVGGWFL